MHALAQGLGLLQSSRCRRGLLRVACLWVVLSAFSLDAVTLQDLRGDPKMSAKVFGAYFKNFEFEFHEEVQEWEDFLKSQKGDCDDYATLADDTLKRCGLQTKLIAVRMPGYIHVVCFVVQDKAYLDYNLRGYTKRTGSAADSLVDIADKVAKSFGASWTSASEFTFKDGLKRLVTTIAKTSGTK